MRKKGTTKKGLSPESYNPTSQELYWQNFWKKEHLFRFNPQNPNPSYTVDTPPPTISGRLHLGHAFSYIQAEIAIAFRRMIGFNVRYPFGLDDNGLPTERLVEKEKGVDPRQMGIREFIGVCHEVIAGFTPRYEDFFRRLGFRWDLNLEYSTISPEVQRISQEIFIKLLKRGLIYRETAPALYCPVCQTSIAQAEVEDRGQEGIFYDLIFRKPDGGELIIATTRPELLPACVAVFVNPTDERYKDIVGTEVETPLGVKVRVFADDRVSLKKGTGAVMCCTYGDETDVYWVRTYGLSERIIINNEGKFLDRPEIPQRMWGKTVEEGRKIVAELLKEMEIIRAQKPITHEVGVHERCGTPIEIIPTPQWFVKILEMKDRLLAAGDEINWYPPFMKRRFREWVSGLKWDWCISRGRFFGIPVPVFYCQDCRGFVLPGIGELPIDPRTDKRERVCPHCNSKRIKGESAVLDTWFTSALTPEINNCHPLNGPLTGRMYPMSMRPHAHDIIRTWTTYSILMGILLNEGVPPWRNLMISGHVLAKRGEKISKKTGGGSYDPMELAKKYSADALRYAMCGGALGRDVYFDEKEVKKGQKLVTKIYNAGRFVLSALRDFNPQTEAPDSLEAFDRWILARTQETARAMARELERYEVGKAKQIFETFFWKDFCDNYLEIIKGRIYGENGKLRRSAQYALYHAFLSILKMAAPFLPHITEEMYHSECEEFSGGLKLISAGDRGYFFQNEGASSIHLCSWPFLKESQRLRISHKIKGGAQAALSVITKIRKAKTERGIRIAGEIPLLLIICDIQIKNLLRPFLNDIRNLSRAEQIQLEDRLPSEISSDVLVVSLKEQKSF